MQVKMLSYNYRKNTPDIIILHLFYRKCSTAVSSAYHGGGAIFLTREFCLAQHFSILSYEQYKLIKSQNHTFRYQSLAVNKSELQRRATVGGGCMVVCGIFPSIGKSRSELTPDEDIPGYLDL